jgi:hypothetical protein
MAAGSCCEASSAYVRMQLREACRCPKKPDDIGPAIASLLSENNRWVNAQRIEVSGGMSI